MTNQSSQPFSLVIGRVSSDALAVTRRLSPVAASVRKAQLSMTCAMFFPSGLQVNAEAISHRI